MKRGKKSYCSHMGLLHMETVPLVGLTPFNSLMRALLLFEIDSALVNR